jgi:hypothetical protein
MSQNGPASSTAASIHLNEALSPKDREHYWNCVRETLREVFCKDEALADQAKSRLERFERDSEPLTLFYHATPLEIAADLAGQTNAQITPDQRRWYQQLLRKWDLQDSAAPPASHIEIAHPED